VDAKGHLFGYDTKDADRLALRTRRIEGLRVPAAALRKGVNVLAMEVHRAPAREVMYTTALTQKGGLPFHPGMLGQNGYWARMGLVDVRLTAPPLAPLVPNAGHAGAPRGFRSGTGRPSPGASTSATTPTRASRCAPSAFTVRPTASSAGRWWSARMLRSEACPRGPRSCAARAGRSSPPTGSSCASRGRHQRRQRFPQLDPLRCPGIPAARGAIRAQG